MPLLKQGDHSRLGCFYLDTQDASPLYSDHPKVSSYQLAGKVWLKDAGCIGVKTWDEAKSNAFGMANRRCGLSDQSKAGD